jgi:hypothetical protein
MKTKQHNTIATEEVELQPLDAVTSDGVEQETELSAHPVVMSHGQMSAMETQLAKLQVMAKGICLNAKYREFDAVGEIVRGVFLGMKMIYKGRGAERQEIPAVQWIDKDKQLWINAGKILVNQLQNVPPNTPIEIIYSEKIKMDVGICKNYEVRALY